MRLKNQDKFNDYEVNYCPHCGNQYLAKTRQNHHYCDICGCRWFTNFVFKDNSYYQNEDDSLDVFGVYQKKKETTITKYANGDETKSYYG